MLGDLDSGNLSNCAGGSQEVCNCFDRKRAKEGAKISLNQATKIYLRFFWLVVLIPATPPTAPPHPTHTTPCNTMRSSGNWSTTNSVPSKLPFPKTKMCKNFAKTNTTCPACATKVRALLQTVVTPPFVKKKVGASYTSRPLNGHIHRKIFGRKSNCRATMPRHLALYMKICNIGRNIYCTKTNNVWLKSINI